MKQTIIFVLCLFLASCSFREGLHAVARASENLEKSLDQAKVDIPKSAEFKWTCEQLNDYWYSAHVPLLMRPFTQ